jgi:hypothetical protein
MLRIYPPLQRGTLVTDGLGGGLVAVVFEDLIVSGLIDVQAVGIEDSWVTRY